MIGCNESFEALRMSLAHGRIHVLGFEGLSALALIAHAIHLGRLKSELGLTIKLGTLLPVNLDVAICRGDVEAERQKSLAQRLDRVGVEVAVTSARSIANFGILS